jgi:hypothetical protein
MVLPQNDHLSPRSKQSEATAFEPSLALEFQLERNPTQHQFDISAAAEILDGSEVSEDTDAEMHTAATAARLLNHGVDDPPGSQESGLCECGRTPTHVREDGRLGCGQCGSTRSTYGMTEPLELVYP